MKHAPLYRPNQHEKESRTHRRRVPFLARFSGRDIDKLKECPDDEVRVSANLGRVRVVAMALHGAGMLSTLSVFGVDLPVASVLAATTAIGLFSIDGLILAAHDRADAEDAIRRIGGTDTPKLTGWTAKTSGTIVRIGVSVVIALLFGGAISAKFFEHDVVAELNRRQVTIDAQFMTEAMDALAVERSALELDLKHAREAVAIARGQVDTQIAASEATLADLETQTRDRRADLDQLTEELRQTEAQAEAQRDIARCELSGTGPNCRGASGSAGDGRLWKLAVARAEAAEIRAEELRDLIALAEKKVAEAEDRLFEKRTNAVTDEVPKGQEAVTEAVNALAAFEAGVVSRAAEMVEEHPLRLESDIRSLSTRIDVLHDLVLKSPGFMLSVLTIKAAAIVFELLPWLAAMMLRRGEYSLRRGRALARLARELRNQNLIEFAEDQLLRAQYERAKRNAANDAMADKWVTKAMSAIRETDGEPANRP